MATACLGGGESLKPSWPRQIQCGEELGISFLAANTHRFVKVCIFELQFHKFVHFSKALVTI